MNRQKATVFLLEQLEDYFVSRLNSEKTTLFSTSTVSQQTTRFRLDQQNRVLYLNGLKKIVFPVDCPEDNWIFYLTQGKLVCFQSEDKLCLGVFYLDSQKTRFPVDINSQVMKTWFPTRTSGRRFKLRFSLIAWKTIGFST